MNPMKAYNFPIYVIIVVLIAAINIFVTLNEVSRDFWTLSLGNEQKAKSKQNETIVAGNISSLLEEMNTSTSITIHDMNETSGAHLLLLKNETKNETKTTIPKVIYKILITADGKVPEIDSLDSKNQRDALLSWTDKSPGYNIRYFGLDDCRSYLKEHFHPVVLRAFDCIKANAGKTDLFRAAVVYREGGWYSDWREVLLHDGLLDKLVDLSVRIGGAFVFTWDMGSPLHRQNNCVMTAFFGGPPQNPMLLEVIRLIVMNVQKEYYGPSPQSITGPCVYGQAYQNIYGKSRNREQLPPITGKYQWNQYFFRPQLKINEVVIQHKYDNPDFLWHEVGGNDYRKMHAEGKYFCSAARNIFHTTM